MYSYLYLCMYLYLKLYLFLHLYFYLYLYINITWCCDARFCWVYDVTCYELHPFVICQCNHPPQCWTQEGTNERFKWTLVVLELLMVRMEAMEMMMMTITMHCNEDGCNILQWYQTCLPRVMLIGLAMMPTVNMELNIMIDTDLDDFHCDFLH